MVARVAFGLIISTALARNEIWWVGTGGCDGAMVNCTDDKESEQALRQINVSPEGELIPVQVTPYPTGGLPVWLQTSGRSRPDCVFAALADQDAVLAFSASRGPRSAVKTGGVAPVHLTAVASGRYLLAANYHLPVDATTSDGAGVSSLSIGRDCNLKQIDFVPHNGSSIDKSRQGGAHVHSVYASRDGRLAYAVDLGQDLIFTYSVDRRGKLKELSRAKTEPGSGPRHLALHPSLDFIYSVQELAQTVSVWKKGRKGKLELSQTESLVPDDQSKEGSKAAEIVMSPDGRSLYVSNRGKLNTITVFSVSQDGSIKQTQQVRAPRHPRGMELAHEGSILLVASQEDTTLESLTVSRDDGTLTSTGHVLKEGLPNHPATLAAFHWTHEDVVLV